MSPFDKPSKDYLSLPKVGEDYNFSQHGSITEIKKVEGGKGLNFQKKETLVLPDGTTATIDKNLGYHYTIIFEDGKILTISSWAPYYAMEQAGVKEGVKFNLNHPEKGSWLVTIL